MFCWFRSGKRVMSLLRFGLRERWTEVGDGGLERFTKVHPVGSSSGETKDQ